MSRKITPKEKAIKALQRSSFSWMEETEAKRARACGKCPFAEFKGQTRTDLEGNQQPVYICTTCNSCPHGGDIATKTVLPETKCPHLPKPKWKRVMQGDDGEVVDLEF